MALKRISDLTTATTPLAGTELVELETAGGDARSCTVQDIAGLAAASDVRTETANYTAVLGDCVIEMNLAVANNLTVPANAAQAFPVGAFLEVWQMGAGQTTIVPDTGVTVLYNADLTLSLKGTDSGCSLRKVATNTWRLIGDMELAP
jgi:hypothetical protein